MFLERIPRAMDHSLSYAYFNSMEEALGLAQTHYDMEHPETPIPAPRVSVDNKHTDEDLDDLFGAFDALKDPSTYSSQRSNAPPTFIAASPEEPAPVRHSSFSKLMRRSSSKSSESFVSPLPTSFRTSTYNS